MDTDNYSHEDTEMRVSAPGVDLAYADKGLASRKLLYGIGTSIAIIVGGIFYAFCAGFRTGYETYIAGLMGVLALYTGGNVAAKHVISKHIQAQQAAQLAAPGPTPRPPVEPLPPDGDEDDGQ